MLLFLPVAVRKAGKKAKINVVNRKINMSNLGFDGKGHNFAVKSKLNH